MVALRPDCKLTPELLVVLLLFMVGDSNRRGYRHLPDAFWKNPEFEMGMTAEFLEIVEHERIVHTEVYDGWPEGSTTVTTRFVEQGGKTTITVDIQYLGQEARDAAMQPGFAEGYEASFQNLDTLLPQQVGRSRR